MSPHFIQVNPNEYEFDFTQGDKVVGASHSSNSHSQRPILFGEYFINDESISRSLGQILDPLLVDFIDIA